MLTRDQWRMACERGESTAQEIFCEFIDGLPNGTDGMSAYASALGTITQMTRIMREMVKDTDKDRLAMETTILACVRGAARGLGYPVDENGEQIQEMQ